MKKTINKIIYYSSTVLISVMMLNSAVMAFVDNKASSESFQALGFPGYMSYFLAIATFLGLIAIWTRVSKILKELAYVGFLITFLLAIYAHLTTNIGSFVPAIFAIVLLAISYIYDKKAFAK